MIVELDDGDDFRSTISLLNDHGFETFSSCSGHTPGSKYPDVTEWMDPYVSVRKRLDDFVRICKSVGIYHHHTDRGYVELKRNVNWQQVYLSLQNELENP